MIFRNTRQIERYLFEHIAKDKKKLFSGQKGIRKVKAVLKELNNPQNKVKIIHIAGTSGKSSTAFLISKILYGLGFKVGLHVSPHLLDIRERFQINNRFINKQKFCLYFNEIYPIIRRKDTKNFERLTYFELLSIFSFYVFYREKVDYAVVETGLGGLYDATNTIYSTNKVVILTKIGLDHTEILGTTIKDIAYQKAMIIKNKNFVISCWQTNSARKVIEEIAIAKKAKLFFFKDNRDFSNVRLRINSTTFDFRFQDFVMYNLQLAMVGRHQAENCALALMSVYHLSQRDNFKFNQNQIRKVLKESVFGARLEIKKFKNKIIILDGAHNPQKMGVLLRNLRELFPNKKFNFLVGFKNNKAFFKMLNQIIPLANIIIATNFFQNNQGIPNFSRDANGLVSCLRKIGFQKCQSIVDSKKALRYLIKEFNQFIVVTGSLYLISELYPIIRRAGDDLP